VLILFVVGCLAHVSSTESSAAEPAPNGKPAIITDSAGFRGASDRLHIKIQGLNAIQLKDIVLLEKAQRIEFSQCKLDKPTIENLGKLLNLTDLEFASTELSARTDIGALAKCKTLKILSYWGGIDVNDEFLHQVGGLTNLQSLYLDGLSEVTAEKFSVIANLKYLSSVNLRSCFTLDDEHCEFVSKLKELSKLNLWGVGKLGSKFLKMCSELPKLSDLTVSALTGLTESDASVIESSRSLTRLELSLLQSDGDQFLARLVESRRVTTLVVHDSRAKGLFIESLASASALKVLVLEGSFDGFVAGSWEKMGDQESIESLTVDDPRMAAEVLRAMARWKKLRELRIRDGSKLLENDLNYLCDGAKLEFIEVSDIANVSKNYLSKLQEQLQSLRGDQLELIRLTARER